jgi:hypothetical protein
MGDGDEAQAVNASKRDSEKESDGTVQAGSKARALEGNAGHLVTITSTHASVDCVNPSQLMCQPPPLTNGGMSQVGWVG